MLFINSLLNATLRFSCKGLLLEQISTIYVSLWLLYFLLEARLVQVVFRTASFVSPLLVPKSVELKAY